MQQLVDGAHRDRRQKTPLRAEEPLRGGRTIGRRSVTALGPEAGVSDAEVVVQSVLVLVVSDTGKRDVGAQSRPFLVEPRPPVEKPDGNVGIHRRQPRPDPAEHRVAGRLRRHPDEHPVRAEPSGQHLRRYESRLGLAFTHRGFEDEQARRGHVLREAYSFDLRGSGRDTEPVPHQVGLTPRRRPVAPPPAAQPQLVPRPPGTVPRLFKGHGGQFRLAAEMLFVTRDPVSHDDQAGQGELTAPARRRHIREGPQIQTQLAGDPLDEPRLDAGPLAFAVSCGAGGPETVRPGHQAVVPGYQRPHPAAG